MNIQSKLITGGAGKLSDAELLALLLRGRRSAQKTISLSHELLDYFGSVRQALSAEHARVVNFPGAGDATYARLQAVSELVRRSLIEKLGTLNVISSPAESKAFLRLSLQDKKHEAFFALFLNSKHHLISAQELFRGTIDSTAVPIREVVIEALHHNAAAMIVAHNHPSGNPEPSAADKTLTTDLQKALALVGVRLLDHFIVGEGDPISFAERGLL